MHLTKEINLYEIVNCYCYNISYFKIIIIYFVEELVIKMKKSIAKNYIYNLFYQILVIILPLVTTPYLSRTIGAENIGIYSYTLSITTYFILFGTLGIAMYGQREIAFVQNDIKKRSKVFYEIFLMKTITLGISMLIFYLSFCTNGEYSVYYRILLLEIFANVLDISWYFQGLEEFKKTVIRNIIVKMVSVGCIFLLVKNSNDLNKYFLIYTLSILFGNMSLWLYLPKYVCKVNLKKLNLLMHLKPTIILFIPQIATQIYTVLDKTMIGTIINNKSEVGYYEQAQKIIKLLMCLATSFGTVMMPRISATFVSGDKEKIKEYMNISFAFIMMLAFPLMFIIISISGSFVPIFYGVGYDKVIPLLCILSPIIVLIGLSNIIGVQYLLPTKQQTKFTISVVVGAIINFILNMLLIKNYASIGAAIATVIAETVVTATQFILVRKEFKVYDVFKISYKYIISSIVMFGCSILVGHLISNNLLSIVIQICVSGLMYFILLIIMKDKLICNGICILKKKLKRF